MEKKEQYQNRALTLYPALNEQALLLSTSGLPVIRKRLLFKNTDTNAYLEKPVFRPALKSVNEYLIKNGTTQILETKNLFLVTENSLDARLAAVNLSIQYVDAYFRTEALEGDLYGYQTGKLSDEGLKKTYEMLPFLVDFGDCENSEAAMTMGNPYLAALAGQEHMKVILFCGLNDPAKLTGQLEVIRVSPAVFRMIQITPELLQTPKIRELLELSPEENKVLRLGEADLDYYSEVCSTLL